MAVSLNAIAAAEALTESATSDEMKQACKNLETEYKALQTAAVNPLTAGYYYIVSNFEAYNNKFGVYPAIFTTPDFKSKSGASMCLYDMFDEKNANMRSATILGATPHPIVFHFAE